MPSIKSVVLAVSAVLCSPALIVLLPFLLFAFQLKVILNVARASKWRVLAAAKLLIAILMHVTFVVTHLKLFLSVAVYYYLRSGTSVKKNIPFEQQVTTSALLQHRRSQQQQQQQLQAANLAVAANASPTLSSTSSDTTPVSVPAFVEAPVPVKLHGCALDVYCSPKADGQLRPVIIFAFGGAWGSGAKWYYAKFAALLRQHCDSVVVVPEYPLYPTGTMIDMLETLHRCIVWTHEYVAMYGGSPKNIWLVGHSAGAHLISLLLLRRAMARANVALPATVTEKKSGEGVPIHPFELFSSVASPVSRHPVAGVTVDFGSMPSVSGAILFAGVYDLAGHLVWEQGRCVDLVSTMTGAVGGYWQAMSPVRILQALDAKSAQLLARHFPKRGVHLVHNSDDRTVSIQQSQALWQLLTTSVGLTAEQCPNVTVVAADHADMVLGPVKCKESDPPHETLLTIAARMAASASSK